MSTATTRETPLMKQHSEIKSKYPDAILLFRVGDFYETFGADAVIASKVLGITLTKRANGAAAYIELAGIPHHALDTYLHKLVRAGYRVAICDQLEDPKLAKGIVKRGVTELVTPGVATNDKLLEHNTNNFLASVFSIEDKMGVCFLDITTGELFAAEGKEEYIDRLLESMQPSEVLISKQQQAHFKKQRPDAYYCYAQDDWIYQYSYAQETLLQHFETVSLKGYGIEEWKAATIAVGAAIHYLKDTAHPNLQHLTQIQRIKEQRFVWMDRFTIRNLELLHSNHPNGHCLLQTIDKTLTPMGGRMLKQWLLFPLTDAQEISNRQGVVKLLLQFPSFKTTLQSLLKQTGDIERLVAKIPLRKVNPRELVQLQRSLAQVAQIKESIAELGLLAEETFPQEYKAIAAIAAPIQSLEQVQNLIQNSLQDDPPAVLAKGNVIKAGLNEELDELRNIAYKGKDYLLQIQEREIQATGISSLKIGFNNVFGYYLEVTHAHKDKVPESWTRKQTLTNAERYITPELKTYEEKILGAEEKIVSLEHQLYQNLLDQILVYIAAMQGNARQAAILDSLLSFAVQAEDHHYVCPTMSPEKTLQIKDGRHPVIEQALPTGVSYIPNDIQLSGENLQIMIITGPNMSGKSAVLRQVALTVLLAHMGSFVPAQAAIIPLTDIIYTRVGASDNLSGGESTFMVEMLETASILNNLTPRSLVILDEIGRGTSTYDGISLAWSIVEYLHQHPSQAFTLFATHYHELNELEHKLNRVQNYHISHQEENNKVVFLRKLKKGGSHHSFGIHVAKMAGMPKTLTDRAMEILALLEDKRSEDKLHDKIKKVNTVNYQLNIFDGLGQDLKEIKQTLNTVDINTLTPVEALLKLNELKAIVKHYQD